MTTNGISSTSGQTVTAGGLKDAPVDFMAVVRRLGLEDRCREEAARAPDPSDGLLRRVAAILRESRSPAGAK